jgi:integrase
LICIGSVAQKRIEPKILSIPSETFQALVNVPNRQVFADLLDYAMILFQLDTGIRPKEAIILTIEQRND